MNRRRFATLLTWLCTTLVCSPAAAESGMVNIGTPPGTIVDSGRHRIHLFCSGSGAPTVILEAGASSFAIDFALVQPEIAKTNRVCSYDRAGTGWSGPNPDVEDPSAVPDILRATLSAAGEQPPYLMVGASMGGVYVRLFQTQHPDEVAGMVLIDSADGSGLFLNVQGRIVAMSEISAEQLRSIAQPQPANITPRAPQTGAPFDRLPADLYRARVELETRLIAATSMPIDLPTMIAYNENQRIAFATLRALATANPHPLSDRPLVVLTRGEDSRDQLRAMHAALARQSTNSRHTVVPNAGHEIHLFEPRAVIDAIRDVAGAIRGHSPLPARPND
jgi:pimeloyl-ACP methyl ester carboxylesterase